MAIRLSSLATSVDETDDSTQPRPPDFLISNSHQKLIDSLWFRVGDKVLVQRNAAEVKYIGPIRTRGLLSRNVYVGAVLNSPSGTIDGVIEGIQYFSCLPFHGIMVRSDKLRPNVSNNPFESEVDSMMMVEDSEYNEEEAWSFWNRMDQFEESEALLNSKEFCLIDEEMSKQFLEDESHDLLSPFSGTFDDPFQSSYVTQTPPWTTEHGRKGSHMTTDSLMLEEISSTYKGPNLQNEPDIEFAIGLVDYYRANLGEHLPRKYAMQILLSMEKLLNETVTGAVSHFEIPRKSDTQLIVVGDVHGQLNDVLWLFYKFGTPSPKRIYLFNGDIADRGKYATEIFLILFAFKLVCPKSILINRGNHESHEMNEVYGFAKEVRLKYGNLMYTKFQDIFNLLPLCIVIEKRVLIVHGGLFREDGLLLEEINSLNRKRACPCKPLTREDRIMFDLLWSDPRVEDGRGPSGRGEQCVAFGPDVTERFLSNNKLDVCIRSHQVPTTLRGFEPVHDGRCVTLFSASNYCGTSGNYGGVIIFDPNLSFEIQEYMAPSLSEVQEVYNETKVATAKIAIQSAAKFAKHNAVSIAEEKAHYRTRRTSVVRIERDLIAKMSRLICEKKDALWTSFLRADHDNDGILSLEVWKNCLDEVVGVPDIPWQLFYKKLKLNGVFGGIDYKYFLSLFRVEFNPQNTKQSNWRFETIQQVFESIMRADLTLKETLIVFDRNCDGTVSYSEFFELLKALKFGLSEPQVHLLMRIITAHHLTTTTTGDERGPNLDLGVRIDVAEFLGRFKVVYGLSIKNDNSDQASAKELWVQDALAAIGRAILSDKAETAARHYLGAEFILSSNSAMRRRSSAVRSAALFQKFKDFAEGPPNDLADVSEDAYGDQNNGYLSYKNFMSAIRQLNLNSIERELGFKLDDDRLMKIARAVDVSGSGRINYLEFLNAFHVVDKNATGNVAEEVWQQICTSFFQQRNALRRALARFDPDGTGKVDAEDFRHTLCTLNKVLGPRQAELTPDQIDLVIDSIDSEEEGLVDYNTFLDSFFIVDVLNQNSEDSANSSAASEFQDISSSKVPVTAEDVPVTPKDVPIASITTL